MTDPARSARRILPVLLTLSLATGCIDNGIHGARKSAVAVVLGDFDDLTTSLVALDVASEPWDGFIVQATYSPADNRLQRGDLQNQAEEILTQNDSNTLVLNDYGTLFVASGTRGFGTVQYNDATLPDNGMITDAALSHVCDFANEGGLLVVTDWAYDLVEHCWPDNIEFVGDDTVVDAAQTGIPGNGVLATVNDSKLAADVGDVVTLDYNYSDWSVINSVSSDTEVLLSGDVSYQPSATEAAKTLTGVPLLVRFAPGANKAGQVIYSTFHLSAQNPTLQQAILLDGMTGLTRGGGGVPDSGGSSGS